MSMCGNMLNHLLTTQMIVFLTTLPLLTRRTINISFLEVDLDGKMENGFQFTNQVRDYDARETFHDTLNS